MQNEYVIVNKSVIKNKIENLEDDLMYLKRWYKKAKENYDNDKKLWEQVDDGEMRAASDAVYETEYEIKILKEILSQSTPLIPEIEKAFEAGIDAKLLSVAKIYCTVENYISNLKLDI